VPVNSDGEREMNDWDFHYKGWETEDPNAHNGVTHSKPFTSERVGCLDMASIEAAHGRK
jgi:hypothetical protein